ncbi:MAG: glucans biosynthesis glucosyltransferase MdoH [Pseudomonadota bacterium]
MPRDDQGPAMYLKTDPMMPPEAPLAMTVQAFETAPCAAGLADRRPTSHRLAATTLWRIGAFGPAALLSLLMVFGLVHGLMTGMLTAAEACALTLVAVTFVWVSFTVSAVSAALLRLAGGCRLKANRPGAGQTVALLVPVFNEDPADVMGNVAAMRAELARRPGRDRFAFFILSDTRDDRIAAAEARAVRHLAAEPSSIPVYYRRRADNTDRKIGNLYDWISRWGAAWEAMIVLDADSLMSGAAIRQLTAALARDPDAGLIQSFPALIRAETLFGRMQEFANAIYGWLFAEGLALWSQTEGNYWGHNAIIRTRAFAESARLPYLRGAGGRQKLILSHDFVEAGLMRRAGWAVRFLPRAGGSFEETPATLVDYILRDRRWCRGNMQHLRIVGARGLHPVSRFHLLQGAASYLVAPAWFALLVVWSALLPATGTAGTPAPVIANGFEIGGAWFLALIYAMLLAPKIAAAAILGAARQTVAPYGGKRAFAATTAVEIGLSILYAPILMVQQTGGVVRALISGKPAWEPQARGLAQHSWMTLVRFHAAEVVIGAGLAGGIVTGLLSPWLTPVMLSLLFAPVLSRLSALRVVGHPIKALRLDTPASLQAPRVARAATAERARMAAILSEEPAVIAAE